MLTINSRVSFIETLKYSKAHDTWATDKEFDHLYRILAEERTKKVKTVVKELILFITLTLLVMHQRLKLLKITTGFKEINGLSLIISLLNSMKNPHHQLKLVLGQGLVQKILQRLNIALSLNRKNIDLI